MLTAGQKLTFNPNKAYCLTLLEKLKGYSVDMFYSCGISLAGLIEQRDSQPLLKLIDSIGDWPVASDDWNVTTGRNTSEPH